MNSSNPWTDSESERISRGQQLLEQLWWSMAKKIVETAGKQYNWTEEQWQSATELFLRPNDYSIIVTYD